MTQQQLLLKNAPDLRTEPPRSPNQLVGDFIILGRILDKCRAALIGTPGEYIYNCPLDQRFFSFAGIDAEAFKAEVAQGKSDEEMLAWVQKKGKHLTREEILAWGYEMRWATPSDAESRAYFEQMRRAAAPDHPYLQTWFHLLDFEEGRL